VPAAAGLLGELRDRDIATACVSNLAAPYRRVYPDLGLEALLPVAVFSCNAGLLRPDPRIFHEALSRLGARPDEAVMVGDDEEDDVAGAAAAGLRAVLVEEDGRWVEAVRRLTGLDGRSG